jgi:hypothetical protein
VDVGIFHVVEKYELLQKQARVEFEAELFLREALDRKLAAGSALRRADIEQAATEGAVQRLRPKLMTVAAVLARSCADPVGDRRGIGRDEAHRRADCRGHDHLHDKRADSGSRLLCDDEGPRAAAGQAPDS